MALVLDTGPLLAALDSTDRHHRASAELLRLHSTQLVIPIPVLAEVDYWIHERLDASVALGLLSEIASGTIAIAELELRDFARIHAICERYADSSVGFVDAAVLAIVERLNEPKLATLDHRHFGMLRPAHVSALELLPQL